MKKVTIILRRLNLRKINGIKFFLVLIFWQLKYTILTGNPVVCMPIGFNMKINLSSITFTGNPYDGAGKPVASKAFQDKTNYNKLHM